MQICLVCLREPNPCVGGIERVSYTLARYWQRFGHKVFFVYAVPAPSVPYEKICTSYYLDESVLHNESTKEQFISILEKEGCDFILNQATQCLELVNLCSYAVRTTHVRLVSAVHFAPHYEYLSAYYNRFVNKCGEKKPILFSIKRFLNDIRFVAKKNQILQKEKNLLRGVAVDSDAIVVLSDTYIPEFKNLSGHHNIVSIPNLIELQTVESIPSKDKYVLYVGRLEYGLKRVDRLLKIWQKVSPKFPDWNIKIVGDGDYGHSLRLLAKKLKLKNISFEGYRPSEDYYSESSIICLTSSCEGFGMVLVEAMQYGCIPVAYDSYTALSDIIEDGKNGYKVTAFKEVEFINKLSTLMTDETLREQLAINAMKTPLKFEASAIAERWIKLFESLI